MASGSKRFIGPLLSVIFVGGGQFYSRRFWTGFWLALIFYGSIAIVVRIWTGYNAAFLGILAALLLVWLYNIFDAYRGATYARPPCEQACPATIAPWIYVNQVAHNNQWSYPFIPFFKTLGLICPAPCEAKCTRRGIDQPVAIRLLKAGVATKQKSPLLHPEKKRIAVIGAGPCGLTLAHSLSVKGYRITVYEKEKRPGGIPAHLIPEFRLPLAVVDAEIKSVLNEHIELHCGVEIGKDLSLDKLVEEYAAVFIATGAWKQVSLSIPGEEKALNAFDILRRTKKGESLRLGTVGVIGGGNTALDVARSLVRLGNKVTVYYRRRIEDMPAEADNLAEAQEEGIEIVPLMTPVAIEPKTVVMAKTNCLEGRGTPVEIVPDCESKIRLDSIVMAVGQNPDTAFLNHRVKIDGLGNIHAKNGRTTHPRIFAGGDVVLGPQTIAHAVGQGLVAADQIDYALRRIPRLFRQLMKETYYPRSVKIFKLNPQPRIHIPHREIAQRLRDFQVVELPVSADSLLDEAERCLVCPLRYTP